MNEILFRIEREHRAQLRRDRRVNAAFWGACWLVMIGALITLVAMGPLPSEVSETVVDYKQGSLPRVPCATEDSVDCFGVDEISGRSFWNVGGEVIYVD